MNSLCSVFTFTKIRDIAIILDVEETESAGDEWRAYGLKSAEM